MDFIGNILNHRSISIVGMAKNAGKTECLNYILGQLRDCGKTVALTSVGVDGEHCDQVTRTPKPEITLYEGMLFVTSETHYRQRRIFSEILKVGSRQTALGRLVTARALGQGKVLLSGPSDTETLRIVLRELEETGAGLTLVDGALSRLSLGAPTVTEAMILATGAALSVSIPQLVRKTRYVYDLIMLEATRKELYPPLPETVNGILALDGYGIWHDLRIPTALMPEQHLESLFRYGTTLFVGGAVSDKFLQYLTARKQAGEITLIVKDFTRIFATMESFYAFLKKGGKIKVLRKSSLLAVCINPVSPEGYKLDSKELQQALQEQLNVPVYDVKRLPVRA